MMRRAPFAVAILVCAMPLFGSVSVKPSGEAKRVDVVASAEPLSSIAAALELHLPAPVVLNTSRDPIVSYTARNVAPETALRGILAKTKLELRKHDARWEIVDPAEPTVTRDVKDAEARVILKSMQKQCGIKNLVIDPTVRGSGTFLFNEVPCNQAFSVVLRTLDLGFSVYSNSVMTVEPRRQ